VRIISRVTNRLGNVNWIACRQCVAPSSQLPPNGLTLTSADRSRKEYRTRDNRGAVGVRWQR